MAKRKKELGARLHKSGATFRVWAPFADGVAVTGAFNNWQPSPLQQDKNGYWTLEVPGAEAGQEYKFVIRRGETELYKNDPRALQVTTATGNGVLVDTDFDWEGTDTFELANMNEQVVYEMHVGTFNRADPSTIGTFDDAREKLDYLQELGVNVIELMPVHPMSGDRGWGYSPNYIYAVESLYGGRRGLLEFVREAHRRGIGVILDLVYNHLGPDNLDLWQFDGWHENDRGGIYFYNDWRAETPWGETRPDYGRPEVQDYLLDNVAMWLADYRLDGVRIDSTIYIRNVKGFNNDPEHDLPDAWRLLQRMNELVHRINPRALTVAEDAGENQYITEAIGLGGAGFNSQWELGFPSALRAVLEPIDDKDRNLAQLTTQLLRHFNADVFKRIIYSDSHDTAANGSARLSEKIAPGKPTDLFARKRNLLASAIILTSPGIPMLFQGQEFNEGGSFNDWQVLDWEKAEKFKGIVEAHRHLIGLRRNSHGHTRGLTGQHIAVTHTDTNNQVLAYHRWMDGGPGDDVVVVANFSNRTLKNYHLPFPRGGSWQVRFNSSWRGYGPDFKEVPIETVETDSGGTIQLAPYSVIILSQDKD